MIFNIDFNEINFSDDKFLIDKLGAYWERTKNGDSLLIEVRDFEHLKEMLDIVDSYYGDFYSAIISFDSPTIFLDNKI